MSFNYPKFNEDVLDRSNEIKIELEKILDAKFNYLKRDIQIKENQLERTKLAIEHEKNNKIDKAINLYKKNTDEESLNPFDFSRLAILYRKSNQLDNEVKLLEKAVYIFENRSYEMDDEGYIFIKELIEALNKTLLIYETLDLTSKSYYEKELHYFNDRLKKARKKQEKTDKK